jgi:hypothetical protein
MSVAPGDEKSTMFADYLTNTYMTQESSFPPSLWVEVPSDSKLDSDMRFRTMTSTIDLFRTQDLCIQS